MKILHTSDWHLGRTLYGKKRDIEFAQFLAWLKDTINQQKIDILLVAGDIFDTTTPSHNAQSLYYQFLCDVASTGCQHIVIIAGNHDSPSFLNAPKSILSHLNVHVVGAKSDSVTEEVLLLENKKDLSSPLAIICAVPYLRDKDLRQQNSGESIDEKQQKLVEGLKQHYHSVCKEAVLLQEKLLEMGQTKVPIIGMGHLFAAGGITTEGDGVRDLYVGNLAHISAEAFPKELDYVALGHLHSHQLVGKHSHIRYSGSPIAMGFGEANQTKKVLIVEFTPVTSKTESVTFTIEEIVIPVFQPLVRIEGDLDKILHALDDLLARKSTAWVEVEYNAKTLVPDLRRIIDSHIEGSFLEIRRIKNRLIFDSILKREKETETLEDLTPLDIFKRCLEANNVIDEKEQSELISLFNESLYAIENMKHNDEDES
ncbi:exonuclease SbcCD subunit D C-terminal domain-containing protein [Thorsellia kenyensis]|uniref:Nuclease SbcCD subunit D n=1 Tax=Thorsellia kenyensis TaxID=1549888 RepID=A0ABV6CDD1_9GAMM